MVQYSGDSGITLDEIIEIREQQKREFLKQQGYSEEATERILKSRTFSDRVTNVTSMKKI